jgi:hypothetical protein
MPLKKDDPSISSTSELFDLISHNMIGNIYLLVHPGNWTDKHYDWYYILLKNKLFNAGKRLLRHANNYDNQGSI